MTATFNVEDAMRRLAGVSKDLRDKGRTKMALAAADVIVEKGKRNAPRGPTGNIKRSIHSRKSVQGERGQAQVGYDTLIAPHWHLVEYGTGRRTVTRWRKAQRNPRLPYTPFMARRGVGFFGREVGPMPERRPLRNAADTTKDQQKRAMDDALDDIIRYYNK